MLLNVTLGGYSNQTFSARNYSWKRRGYPNIVWFIDYFEKDHCLHRWVNWRLMKAALDKYGIK